MLVLKLGVLIYLIKYLMDTGDVKKTSVYFATIYLLVSIVFGFQEWSWTFFIVAFISFGIDFLLAYAYFWLIDRFQNNSFLFYLIIILGIGVNIILRILFTLSLQ